MLIVIADGFFLWIMCDVTCSVCKNRNPRSSKAINNDGTIFFFFMQMLIRVYLNLITSHTVIVKIQLAQNYRKHTTYLTMKSFLTLLVVMHHSYRFSPLNDFFSFTTPTDSRERQIVVEASWVAESYCFVIGKLMYAWTDQGCHACTVILLRTTFFHKPRTESRSISFLFFF